MALFKFTSTSMMTILCVLALGFSIQSAFPFLPSELPPIVYKIGSLLVLVQVVFMLLCISIFHKKQLPHGPPPHHGATFIHSLCIFFFGASVAAAGYLPLPEPGFFSYCAIAVFAIFIPWSYIHFYRVDKAEWEKSTEAED